jgi:hypothetical protein
MKKILFVLLVLVVSLCRCTVQRELNTHADVQQNQAQASTLNSQVTATNEVLVSHLFSDSTQAVENHSEDTQIQQTETSAQSVDIEEFITVHNYYESGAIQSEITSQKSTRSVDEKRKETAIIINLRDSVNYLQGVISSMEMHDTELYSLMSEEIENLENALNMQLESTETKKTAMPFSFYFCLFIFVAGLISVAYLHYKITSK